MPRFARLWCGIAVLLVGLLASVQVGAQDATPEAGTPVAPMFPTATVEIKNVDDEVVGEATFAEVIPGRVAIEVTVTGLAPGMHGIHVHEVGVCDQTEDEPFASAGAHYNPTGAEHSGPGGHAGDLGNIEVADDGTGTLLVTVEGFTLSEGELTVFDADGSSLVIHENEDDLETQPSGDSGGRIACGVISEPDMGLGTPIPGTVPASPVASPEGTPVASPES